VANNWVNSNKQRKEDFMFKPLADRVLIKPLEAEVKTKGGIYIPDTAKEAPDQGEVVALGNGKMTDGKKYDFTVKKGDKVIFKYAQEIEVDNTSYKILKEEDILGII
jgi:chaperonin GroES